MTAISSAWESTGRKPVGLQIADLPSFAGIWRQEAVRALRLYAAPGG